MGKTGFNNRRLIHALKEELKDAPFLERIKTVYRPLICPYGRILELIPQRSTVFDIGCGSGALLFLAAKYTNPINLGGIEIQTGLVDSALKLVGKTATPVTINT